MMSFLIDGRPSMTPKRACAWLRQELGIDTSPGTIRRLCDSGRLRFQLIETRPGRTERHTTDRWLREAFIIETGTSENSNPSPAQTTQDEEARTAVALAEIAALRKGGRQ